MPSHSIRDRQLAGVRIVVTGGAGFVGGNVTAALLLSGADVKVIDDLSTGRIERLARARTLGFSDGDLCVADVRSYDCAEAIRGWQPQVLVHLAGQSSLPSAIRSPLRDADINIRGSVNVLEACRAVGVERVVYAASAAIYGQVPAEQLPVTEGTLIAPSSPYGLSKATALRYLELFHRDHGLPYVALAISNVYGPGQTAPACGVIPQLVRDFVDGRPIRITGDGQQTRDFVHVGDVADAVVLACWADCVGLVNIASGRETSVAEVVEQVCRITGTQVARQFVPAVFGEARRMVMDAGRAHRVLGWQSRVLLADGIAEVVADVQRRRAEVAG
ncbi:MULTISPECIES: NAD-dependent epimerase/dehydratase family protein [Nocardia]|nr:MULTISPECIES: NAD-dependent epimerase/dehydratase family protein [Nocardia]